MEDKIFHRAKTYMLEVNPEKQELQITLTLLSRRQKKTFKALLSNDHLPKEVQKNLRDISIVYELLLDQQGFKVDEEEGKIIFKSQIRLPNKKIQILTQLVLQQQEEQEVQIKEVINEINILRGQVAMLKNFLIERDKKVKGNEKRSDEVKIQIQDNIDKVRQDFWRQLNKIDFGFKEERLERSKIQVYVKQKNRQFENNISSILAKIQILRDEICEMTDQKIVVVKEKIESLENQVQNTIMKDINKVNEKAQMIDKQVKQRINKEISRVKGRIEVVETKIEDTTQNVMQRNRRQYNRAPSGFKQKQKIQYQEKVEFYYKNQFTSLFKINNKIIQYTGPNKNWTALMGNQPLKKDQAYQFRFLILQTNFSSIRIGICDRKKSQNQQYPLQDHCIFLLGESGQIFIPKYLPLHSDQRFQKVDIKKCLISFQIKGEQQMMIQEQSLGYLLENKQFVPFICLQQKGDTVKWFW